ncbi:unnamed protein product, partial [Polarella glacialis]
LTFSTFRPQQRRWCRGGCICRALSSKMWASRTSVTQTRHLSASCFSQRPKSSTEFEYCFITEDLTLSWTAAQHATCLHHPLRSVRWIGTSLP